MMPSELPVDEMSAIDDLTSLWRGLVEDRREAQNRRENDRELRRQDDERLRTKIFKRVNHKDAAFASLRPVSLVSGSEPLPGLRKQGESAPVGVCQLSVRQQTCPGVV